MRRKPLTTLLISILALATITAFAPTASATAEDTEIYFEGPSEYDPDLDGNYTWTTDDISLGYKFNATIKIRNVTELFSWQIRVYFNNTVLNCTNAYYHPDDPVSSGPHIPVTPSIENGFNATHGYVQHGVCGLPGYSYSGSFPICLIEFLVIMEPPEGDCLESALSLNNTKTYLLWTDGTTEIECTKINGWYSYCSVVVPPPKPWLELTPQNVTVHEQREVFGVDVTIWNVTEALQLVGVEFKVTFNSSIVRAVDKENGTFLEQFVNETAGEQGVNYTFYEEPELNYATVGIRLLPDENSTWHPPFPEGNGTLITILFNTTVAPPAETEIQLVDTVLVDKEDNEIDHDVKKGTVHVKVTEAPDTDLNDDRIVDIKDLAIGAVAFGSYPEHERWDPRADINGDGTINIRDLILIARDFGTTA